MLSNSDDLTSIKTHAYNGRTQWDETESDAQPHNLKLRQAVDPIEAALAKVLERATDNTTIAMIVTELAARRAKR